MNLQEEKQDKKEKIKKRRIIFCLLIIAIWGVWILNAPEDIKYRKSKIVKKKKVAAKPVEKIEEESEITQEKIPIIIGDLGEEKKSEPIQKVVEQNNIPTTESKKNISSGENNSKKDLKTEKVEDKIPEEKDEKIISKEIKETQEIKKPAISSPKINTSEIISETKKALSFQKENKEDIGNTDINLRKEAPKKTKKNKLASVDSWIPRYLQDKNISNENIQDEPKEAEENNGSIELIGLVENDIAIVKNTSNGKVEFLKSGDEYEGLTLTKIGKEEVTFEDKNSGASVVKKLLPIE